jgi:SAM-dependent methyltransferase
MNKHLKSHKRDGPIVGPRAQAAIVERLKRRTLGGGKLSGPCLPALIEHYVAKAIKLFDVLDRPLGGAELSGFRSLMKTKLEEGFEASPHARFVLSYHPSETDPMAIACSFSVIVPSLEEQITEWVQTSGAIEPFGKYPDAKVLDVARQLQERGPLRVLDVGAGTGRNSLPLARMGLNVVAIEPVAQFAEQLRKAATDEGLSCAVIEGDVFDDATECAVDSYELVVLSEVVTHFTEQELRNALPKLVAALSADGTLLLNAFVARSGYQPDALARQASSSVWSSFFTRQELAAITLRGGLELVSDEPALDYEQAHSLPEAWPPTSWYVSWAQGKNLFATSEGTAPIELRWLAYRRSNRSAV